uniref:Uncharacterized protein AlNc14C43G3605 n=1 Tax=Albugo laibachii Nc14 TaxID=890382 RepID=F0WA74_9STRA|nr:hypothetical protein ALNC14_041870 [Albugo laibachii Nc14]|eukprot:CCA18044.1 hypothetical protein ALNC14_041870 [Albugo laibachii Nc14]
MPTEGLMFLFYQTLIRRHDKTTGYEPKPPEYPLAAPLGAFDNAASVSAEISQPSEHGASECGADRLDRIERLIGNLISDMARERVEQTFASRGSIIAGCEGKGECRAKEGATRYLTTVVKTRNTRKKEGANGTPLVGDPKTYREVTQSEEDEKWRDAMRSEIDSLKAKGTWELIIHPPGQKLLHSKWDGTLERFKARLVACGNEKAYGEDYTLTFSAVMDMTTEKVVLDLARVWGVPARYGDVPNAYVKVEKEEDLEIVLQVPQGMEFDAGEVKSLGTSDKSKMALNLRNSLYELKQAGRLWAQLLYATLLKSNPALTPIGEEQDGEDEGDLLPSDGDGKVERPTVNMFHSLIGSLFWVSRCTRPDISFAVHRSSRRTHAPREFDWRWAKRSVGYSKGTVDLKLQRKGTTVMGETPTIMLQSYTDEDHAADRADRKSFSGGVICLNGMIVGWMCRNQASGALSTMEAEFVAALLIASNLLGLKELLGEIGIKGEDSEGRAKHIAVRLKFIKNYSQKEVIKVDYCESRFMRADILTKTFAAPRIVEKTRLVMLKRLAMRGNKDHKQKIRLVSLLPNTDQVP